MKLFVLLSIIYVISFIRADIPVHCLKSQIVGKWEFKATKTSEKNISELYKFSCGHSIPSKTATANKFNLDPSDFDNLFTINLKDNDSAELNIKDETINGKWTMIYDEGYEISFKNHNFFVFSRYGDNKRKKPDINSKYVSYCYSTLIGWYRIDNKWGCFYGYKIGVDRNEVTNGEAENKQKVVQNEISKQSDRIDEDVISFIESKFNERIELNENFKDHHKIVERINYSNQYWEAENYSEYKGLTLKDLNKIAGRIKYKKHSKEKITSIAGNKSLLKSKNNFLYINHQELPESYSNKEFMSRPKNQGNCGSCYTVSTLGMLESRIRRNYPELVGKYFPNKDDLLFSVDHVLRCSVYNQGCDGGYSYLVLKFFKEMEILHKKCFQQDSCEKKCLDDNLSNINFRVTDYYYLGGSYGKCNEDLIKKEIYENGPFVISFEPDYSFMFYKKGIYSSPIKSWMNKNISKPEWQKVDHSVVVLGWGSENINGKEVKYWLLQNSWGENWGEDGYIKFLRGSDHLGIESICEAGKIEIIK